MSEQDALQLLQQFLQGEADPQACTDYLDRLAYSETRERLGLVRMELAQLQAEKLALTAEMQRLRAPDVECLLTFLPAIFRNFWGAVRPDELAMMAGKFTTITVPSPYPEPSADTVLMMKQRLQRLPAEERAAVLAFCRDLPHRLQIRPEMKEFF